MTQHVSDALFLGFLFGVCVSAGLFLVLRPNVYQRGYLALLARFPGLAGLVPWRGFIASRGYVWLARFVGVGFLVISVFVLLGLLGALGY